VDRSGKTPQITSRGTNLLNAFSPGGSRDKNYQVKLEQGQVHHSDTVLLEDVYRLAPNQNYYVSAVYEEKWIDGWTGSVTSNVVRVKGSASP